MHALTRQVPQRLPREQRCMNCLYHRIVPPQRDQHVADGEAAAPDRVDHGVIGACGGIGACNLWIGAEMAREFQRQLHAR